MHRHPTDWLVALVLMSGCSSTRREPATSVLHKDFLESHLTLPANAHRSDVPDTSIHVDFSVPTEAFPSDAKGILSQAPPGAYISVGSERAAAGFVLTPNATHLVNVDRDPQVQQFNRINRELLRISETIEDYRHLRLKSTFDEWTEAAKRAPQSLDTQLLFDENNFISWRTKMRAANFAWLHEPPTSAQAPFAQANYLYDNLAFLKLQEAARSGRWSIVSIDLQHLRAVHEFFAALQRAQVSLSVFDVSSAWWSAFIKPDRWDALLDELGRSNEPRALLVLTDHPVIATESGPMRWDYLGVKILDLSDPQKRIELTRKLKLREQKRAARASCTAQFQNMLGQLIEPDEQRVAH